ncbi:hypothetical protein GN244_ATG10657 [Phytophthora infestans]|uniref:Uncharacterized protein n=1 Tax=Phytophthora infestans TaxID=4787 RepID=A0A833T1D9_PHYIN|nr:hypothetical protein GN244_ATG10657 [Phytophthora infestans]
MGPSTPGDDRFGLRFENQRRYDGSRGYGSGCYGGGYEEGRVWTQRDDYYGGRYDGRSNDWRGRSPPRGPP